MSDEQPPTAPISPRRQRATSPEDDRWFVEHGLPWFVPERRERAHRALHDPRLLVGLVVVARLSLAGGIALAWLLGSPSLAPVSLVTVTGLAAAAYAGTPGVTSHGTPAASRRRVCSVSAE